MLEPKAVALGVPLFFQVKDAVRELIDTGHEVSALPGQVIIAILLLAAIVYIITTERTRKKERERIEEERKARETKVEAERKERELKLAAEQNTRELNILTQVSVIKDHHESFVTKAEGERERHRVREEFLTSELMKQNERSIAAMNGMSNTISGVNTTIATLKDWLQENLRSRPH